MQTFCLSPQHSFSGKQAERGFSLIELLISAAIIGIITAMVMVRFTSFDSTVVLKGLAYDIASSIRDAQVYAVSVVRTDGNSEYPYGMHFASGTTYIFFRYKISTPGAIPDYGDGANVDDLNVFSIGRTMRIKDICAMKGGVLDCGLEGLDISFRRPEFHALFNGSMYSPAENSSIESVTIQLDSTANAGVVWDVNVSLLGQITVKKE